MDETILFPSPNWFQPSAMSLSPDGWLVYSGPSQSLCVLEPLPQDYNPTVKGQPGYTAHVVNRAHPEKIVCVDVSPEWPERRAVLTGSADGSVKQWSFERNEGKLKIKSTHSHEIHRHDHEEVVGVGYCKDGYAVTVGASGNIVKWDLNSNVAKTFNHVLKNFKPTCMACSPHIHMNVAIGTKQGVLLVLDLNAVDGRGDCSPRIIYKVRCQDNEILQISWCPQYEVAVRKALKESEKRSLVTQRMEKIRQEATSPDNMKRLDERVKNSQTLDQPVKINEKFEPIVDDAAAAPEQLDESGIGKTLPEDSFDCEEVVVQEDDTFDIYKDHEADEFGHKKYQPIEIRVKVPVEKAEDDYLSECEKLKQEILNRKAQAEAPIEILVDAMEKVQVGNKPDEQVGSSKSEPPVEGKIIKGKVESSVHIHKHLLATIGKRGSIRIWSKAGKLVGSCVVPCSTPPQSKGARVDKRNPVTSGHFTLVWCKPDTLLIADGKNQILECNPLKIDCKNKLEWSVVHALHKKNVFVLATSAPRVQTPEMAARGAEVEVWSASQDRILVRYCLNSKLAHCYMTCGGFLYMLQPCPYDARKVAVAVGDGAVRVWKSEILEDDEGCIGAGQVFQYWQNVQGKVLAIAWHPTKENILAFATAEARVGLIDTSGAGEKPAKLLHPGCAGGVYSLSWAAGMVLLAAGAGELLRYDAARPDKPPQTIEIALEGAKWEISSVECAAGAGAGGLVVLGSSAGNVAVCASDFSILAAAFIFKKMIHMTEWHPAETSSASEPSSYRNLIAVSSLDRSNNVAILEYDNQEESGPTLTLWKTLIGHSAPVLQVAWSPHHDRLLLSTSQDATVRVWDVEEGACVSIFGGHTHTTVSVAWSPRPEAPAVLSGGADCSLRLWHHERFPADHYYEVKHEVDNKKNNNRRKKNKKREEGNEMEEENEGSEEELDEQAVVAAMDGRKRVNKKFLLPMMYKQTRPCPTKGVRKMLQKYLERNGIPVPWSPTDEREYGLDFIKIFGTINEVNEVLDDEASRLLDTGCVEPWVVLCVVRGYIDQCVQQAAARNLLDPFIISIAPCVSFKYWKDATLLYLQQMERLVAKGQEYKFNEARVYGGAEYRRTAVLLGLHDVRGAIATLQNAHLYLDAYVLCRTRYMESVASEILKLWAIHSSSSGEHNMSAVLYIALGELSQAAAVLGKSSDEEALRLAADIATLVGQTTFAGHVQRQCQLMQTQKLQDAPEPEPLPQLPSRAQALIERVQPSAEDNDDNDASISDSSSIKDADESNQLTATDDISDTENTHEVQKAEKPDGEQHIIESVKEALEHISEADGETLKAKFENIEKSQLDENSTKELLERLPGMMTTLMKESHQNIPIPNGMHKGDGDSNINAEDKTVKVPEPDSELQEKKSNVE